MAMADGRTSRMNGKEQAVADEQDPKSIDRPSSDAVKGEKAADPIPGTSSAEKASAPEKVKEDLVIEDRFEATDN
jgi:hypothetical protein